MPLSTTETRTYRPGLDRYRAVGVDVGVFRLDRHGASRRHRLDRIDDQVVDDLAYLSRIDLGAAQIFREPQLALYIRSAYGQSGGVPDDGLEADQFFYRLSAFGERKQLLRQVLCPHACRLDLIEPRFNAFAFTRLHFGQGNIGEDCSKEVIEVVGDPAREQADALQFLDPRFKPAALFLLSAQLDDLPDRVHEQRKLVCIVVPEIRLPVGHARYCHRMAVADNGNDQKPMFGLVPAS